VIRFLGGHPEFISGRSMPSQYQGPDANLREYLSKAETISQG